MTYNQPGLRERLASEYVLGTLSGGARRRMEQLLFDDPDWRDMVRDYASLNQLVELIPPVTPSAGLWPSIVNGTRAEAANDAGQPAPTGSGLWRGWAIAATLLLAVLTVYLGSQTAPQESSRFTYVVVITDDAQSRASWVVGAEPETGLFRIKALNPQPLPADRVFQLWMKVKGEEKVRSVGLIPNDGQASLDVNQAVLVALANAVKFGVSIEPPGGSPTGQPTTTPLYHGKIIGL